MDSKIEILGKPDHKSGSMGDATMQDLENGYNVVEKGAPKHAYAMLMGEMGAEDCCNGGVLGRPSGMER